MLGCHNPTTHSFSGGFLVDVEEIKEQIIDLIGQDGITLSGGDPFFQAEACSNIAEFCKDHGLNVWAYTGFTFEELIKKSRQDSKILDLLKSIDVLIDGKFIEEQKDLSLLFRGSKNQRILDVKKSLEEGRAIEAEKYLSEEANRFKEVDEKSFTEYAMENLNINSFGKVQHMFI